MSECKYCEVHSKELKPVTRFDKLKHWLKSFFLMRNEHEWHDMGKTDDGFVHSECRICGKIIHDIGIVQSN